jgi:hypothetical protein
VRANGLACAQAVPLQSAAMATARIASSLI